MNTVTRRTIEALQAALANRDAHIAKIESRHADEIAKRDAHIAEVESRYADLLKRFNQQKEQLNQNSKNSHLPPSSDRPGTIRTCHRGELQEAIKRTPGGQKGHQGNHRELLPEVQVHEVIDLLPPACEHCAHPLTQHPGNAYRRYQQVDLRKHCVHVTEWRRHEIDCGKCGGCTIAAYDSSVIPTLAFGPRFHAMIVMLTGAYHLSRRQVISLISHLFEVEISLGSVSQMEKRAVNALQPSYDACLHEAQKSDVKHTDATTWLKTGQVRSLWTLVCAVSTVYGIFSDGCRTTIESFFGERIGIMVSDRASIFGFWEMSRRQICHAHLLRKFVSFSERDGPEQSIGKELLELTVLMFKYWRDFKQGVLTREKLKHWMEPVRRDYEQVLKRTVSANLGNISGVCQNIIEHIEALWTFVEYEGVGPTNNDAERALRCFVLWRRRSYGNRSERGEQFAARIMTISQTARQQSIDVFHYLTDVFKAHMHDAVYPSLFENIVPA